MDINAILYAVGATGLFTSRAFVPAFFTACYIRWGKDIPIFGNAEMFSGSGSEPTWFTSDTCIGILGVLALLEIAADKVPEAQEAMSTIDKYSKTALSMATYMGVASAQDLAFVQDTLNVQQAGFFDTLMALATGALVYFTCTLRDESIGYLRMLDEDNDLGLRNLISWLEDAWVFLGVFLIFAYPPLMVLIVAGIYATMARIRKHYRNKEEASKKECPSCQTLMYKSAVECPKCHTKNTDVKAIGFWGQTKPETPAPESSAHAVDLAMHKRCPKCGTHLDKRKVQQTCPACSHETFSDPALRDAYRSRVMGRVPVVMTVCFLIGMIPVVGLVLGIIYYRVQLVSPYRRYMPLHRSFFAKWFTRLFFLVLMFFQLVPIVGGLSVSIMAFISYNLYRRGFVSQIQKVYA